MEHYYEKYNDNLEPVRCPIDDKDGSITGRIVLGAPRWFDENPEERIARGWIKHLYYTEEEMKELFPHNRQTQFLVKLLVPVDEYTVQDDYRVMDKSEEQLLFEEMLEIAEGSVGFTFGV